MSRAWWIIHNLIAHPVFALFPNAVWAERFHARSARGKYFQPARLAFVVLRHRGRVLGVSRRAESADFGLPGGKVERGEEPVDAAARELREETGVVIAPGSLALLHSSVEPRSGLLADTYAASLPDGERPRESESGTMVEWVDWKVLSRGSFWRYNKRVMRAARGVTVGELRQAERDRKLREAPRGE